MEKRIVVHTLEKLVSSFDYDPEIRVIPVSKSCKYPDIEESDGNVHDRWRFVPSPKMLEVMRLGPSEVNWTSIKIKYTYFNKFSSLPDEIEVLWDASSVGKVISPKVLEPAPSAMFVEMTRLKSDKVVQ